MRALGTLHLAFVCSMGLVYAQAPTHAAEIEALLDHHIEAVGGGPALGRIQSRRNSGWIERHGVRVPFVQTQRAPQSLRMETRFPRPGTLVQGFDGTEGWMLHPTQGPRAIKGAELAALAASSWLHPALHIRSLFPLRRWLGARELDGRAVLALELGSGPGARFETWYFDAVSYQLLCMKRNVDGGPQGEVAVTVRFEDHRGVDGITLPFRVRTQAGRLETLTQVESVEHNLDLPETLFRPKP